MSQNQATSFSNHRFRLFLITGILVLIVLWLARTALIPYAIGMAVAYLIAPLIRRVHNLLPPRIRSRAWAQSLSIFIVYVGFVMSLVVGLALILPPLASQANELLRDEALGEEIQDVFTNIGSQYASFANRSPEVAEKIETAVADFVPKILEVVNDLLEASITTAFSAMSWLLAAVMVPIWLFYILSDTGKVLRGSLSLVPRGLRSDVEAIRVIIDRVFSAYIRGQLLIAFILGALMSITLWLLGVEYALFLGVLNGVLGFIPFIGSIIGAIPAIGIALLGGTGLAVKVLIAFVVIQQVDGAFISPRVQGDSVSLSPALIIVVLVIGQQLFGLAGLILAVPLTAIARDIVHYLYLRLGQEDAYAPVAALDEVGYGEAATPSYAQRRRYHYMSKVIPGGSGDKHEAVRDMFGRIAGQYDLMNMLMTGGTDRLLRKRAVRALNLPAGACRVLDVGTGTGDLAIDIARSHSLAEVIGLDYTGPMLAHAPAKAQAKGVAERLTWLRGDGHRLPFDDDSFDGVTSAFVLRNFADLHVAYAEMARVVRPGRRVVALEISPGESGAWQSAFDLYFQNLVPMVGKVVTGDSEAYRYLPDSVAAFLKPEEVAKVMRDAGLEALPAERFDDGINRHPRRDAPSLTRGLSFDRKPRVFELSFLDKGMRELAAHGNLHWVSVIDAARTSEAIGQESFRVEKPVVDLYRFLIAFLNPILGPQTKRWLTFVLRIRYRPGDMPIRDAVKE